ncbi:hypothetical protein [Dehalogenimonas etheniformans]|uniref:Uncharacterized protein n=1 Tax=Dehalogenimonas etheniformans TaxID=1536648 RepID=A0A2P5P5E9_9CHLR|nr:hypothetical protein [Dehalogenimonas etheniformans]PPD57507.1 hypothetical protein JP09_009270 [Dehalogenimonas etheniformans]QNT76869.1 hypothetical protein HX448_09365 [Dehalogenimonas etheniformans]
MKLPLGLTQNPFVVSLSNHERIGITVLIVSVLLISTACTSPHPSTTPPTQTTTQYPADGTVLPIEPVQGSGNAWSNGIKFSNIKFTFGYLNQKVLAPSGSHQLGEPCIYFTGTLTNESSSRTYVNIWTSGLETWESDNLVGLALEIIDPQSSDEFKIRLSYSPSVTTVTINANSYLTHPP